MVSLTLRVCLNVREAKASRKETSEAFSEELFGQSFLSQTRGVGGASVPPPFLGSSSRGRPQLRQAAHRQADPFRRSLGEHAVALHRAQLQRCLLPGKRLAGKRIWRLPPVVSHRRAAHQLQSEDPQLRQDVPDRSRPSRRRGSLNLKHCF